LLQDRTTAVRQGEIDGLGIDPHRPLLVVDVDEVLGLFMAGFGSFLEGRGLEFRVERFALFQNIYRPGEAQHLEIAEGKRHFDDFFRYGAGDIEPSPGAAKALRALAARASVVILSNAPAQARLSRARWLGRHGLDYPLVLSSGPKGPLTAAMAARTAGPTAFVDDLLSNLDSVAESAPAAARFQHVADARLRPFAPSAPERHTRIDDWAELHDAITAAIAA
jgi:hypothetical protein